MASKHPQTGTNAGTGFVYGGRGELRDKGGDGELEEGWMDGVKGGRKVIHARRWQQVAGGEKSGVEGKR